MSQRWTVGNVLAAAHEYLVGQDLPGARLEAEKLLAHSLSLSRFDLYTQFDRPLDDDERGAYRLLLRARSSGRPLQHLTGRQAFRRLDLKMADGVFIPRAETELLVEKVLERANASRTPVLELGTGTGAICISIATESPQTSVWTTDISQAALELAKTNAADHGVVDRIQFLQGDLFSPLPDGVQFAAIVSNPPYIPTQEIETLSLEVRDHEPRAALDGGPSGLDFYERIIADAPARLQPAGLIAFEVGLGQASAVASSLAGAGFRDVEVTRDYGGIDRIVSAVWGS